MRVSLIVTTLLAESLAAPTDGMSESSSSLKTNTNETAPKTIDIKNQINARIIRMTRYSAAAYSTAFMPCKSPAGGVMIAKMEDKAFGTSLAINTNFNTAAAGYVARDDAFKEIVVVYKGSSYLSDFVQDGKFNQVPMDLKGVPKDDKVLVATGFQANVQALQDQVIPIVRSQLAMNPGYAIHITGHSLGGSMAAISSVQLKSAFPDAQILVTTQGEPRGGNKAFADRVDKLFPPETMTYIRATSTTDFVPQLPPVTNLGGGTYVHHSGEVWQSREANTPETTVICAGQEDPNCTDGNGSTTATIIPKEHIHYWGVLLASGDAVECGGKGGLGFTAPALLVSSLSSAKTPTPAMLARNSFI